MPNFSGLTGVQFAQGIAGRGIAVMPLDGNPPADSLNLVPTTS